MLPREGQTEVYAWDFSFQTYLLKKDSYKIKYRSLAPRQFFTLNANKSQDQYADSLTL